MARSPTARQDKIPLTPPKGNREPSLNEISFGGHHLSEIPDGDAVYYPRDAAGGRLFRRRSCDCCYCDCDCTSDGLAGCLRRNRRCLFMLLILTLTTTVILLTLSNLSHESRETYVAEPTELPKWEFHRHYYNFSQNVTKDLGEKGFGDRMQIPVIEDSREPDYFIYVPYMKKILKTAHEENEGLLRLRKKRGLKVVDSMIQNQKVLLEDVLSEPNEMGESLMNHRSKFLMSTRTVFEPFEMTPTTPAGWTDGHENDVEDGTNKGEETEAATEPWTVALTRRTFESYDSAHEDNVDHAGYVAEAIKAELSYNRSRVKDELFNFKKLTQPETTTAVVVDKETMRSHMESESSQTTFKVTDDPAIDGSSLANSKSNEKAKNVFKTTDYFLAPYDDFDEPSSNHLQEPTADTVGISLSEARKRKQENRKHQLLNSKVVSAPSDILFPTGPDDAKPIVETIKTSQQLSFTPSAFAQYFLPYQMCFYANPHQGGKPSVRESSPKTFKIEPPSFFRLPHHLDEQKSSALYHFPTQQNILSFNINNYAGHGQSLSQAAPSAGSLYAFTSPQHFPNLLGGASHQLQQQPLFCTYLQPPMIQLPPVTSTSELGHAKCVDCDDEFYNHLSNSEEITLTGKDTTCMENTVSCRDGSSCIPMVNWCDNKVHCKDGSDEIYCSCRERLSLERLCDGYLDCPQGEDEIGCNGCPKSTFSCDTFDEPRGCIPISKRCDNVRDCPTGKDEMDCSALFPQIGGNYSHHVSYSKGFLHRNWKGDWYPVCVEVGSNQWSNEACSSELASMVSEPRVSLAQVSDHYKGQFMARREDGRIMLQEHCKGHVSTYVKCPEMRCGTRIMSETYAESRFRRYVKSKGREWWNRVKKEIKEQYKVEDVYWKMSPIDEDKIPVTVRQRRSSRRKSKRGETGRVVGGKESEPRAWPWVVALYKNGDFHCGGIILDEKWIMTAAHCVESYWKNYYEVRSGMLRRFSFSPMEQVRGVSDVVIHEKYNQSIMSNDVALLRLQRPLLFNKWVRPACLPSLGNGELWGPLPGSRCIATGWGAIREHGRNPDHMREVEIPILPKCRHIEDLQGGEICAGVVQGGKDTCQGDSGGPLLCRDSRSTWYAAGIVSHGEGCARPGEPGAYTRVSMFMDWIIANSNDFQLPSMKPLTSCPGFRCTSATKRCIAAKWVCNGLTDCLNGEDETDCPAKKLTLDNRRLIFAGTSLQVKEKNIEGGSWLEEESKRHRTPTIRSLKTMAVDVTEEEEGKGYYNTPNESLPGVFRCRNIIQTVMEARRCDGIADCEDGTDETLCTCRDILLKRQPGLVCDGRIDCEDATEEENCGSCSPKEFNCRRSKQCLSKSKVCDGEKNCDHGEDEEGCYALFATEKDNSPGKPRFRSQGRLMIRKGDVWTTVCHNGDALRTAIQACSSFGSNGYEKFSNGTDSTSSCLTLDLTCSRWLINDLGFYGSSDDGYMWPWRAFVYADGSELCSGVLLESDWVLTALPCVKQISLRRNHVVAKLGSKRRIPGMAEFGTQFIRVDWIVSVRDSDMVLLHLSRPANVTWYVRPLSVRFWFDTASSNGLCITTGEETAFLKPVLHCRDSRRCYRRINADSQCGAVIGHKPQTGVIVCQSLIGWYPSSIYHERNSFCDSDSTYESVLDRIADIQSTMGRDVGQAPEVPCSGMRCREGFCLSKDKICDGKADCPSGEDENDRNCSEKSRNSNGCSVGELRCANGKCILKTLFADGNDDCGDGSDEPNQPTCGYFLSLSSSHRTCDGVRNCYDKSDEPPDYCPCTASKFNCSLSGNTCVPFDFVCDGEKDCAHGEDEAACVGYKKNDSELNENEIELIHMSFGVWHSLCSPIITNEQANQICMELGFRKSLNTCLRNATRLSPALDPFTIVKLNSRTSIRVRGDGAFAKTEVDGHCQVMSVQCD